MLTGPIPACRRSSRWGEPRSDGLTAQGLDQVTLASTSAMHRWERDMLVTRSKASLNSARACEAVGGEYQGDDTTCDPNPCLACFENADCYDGDYCTVDVCEGAPNGTCVYTLIESRPYADVYPARDGDGAVEIMDTLCILDAASGTGDCLTDVGGYMMGDVFPCWPPEGTGPDGAVEIMDILFVLDAAAGEPRCSPWCL